MVPTPQTHLALILQTQHHQAAGEPSGEHQRLGDGGQLQFGMERLKRVRIKTGRRKSKEQPGGQAEEAPSRGPGE